MTRMLRSSPRSKCSSGEAEQVPSERASEQVLGAPAAVKLSAP